MSWITPLLGALGGMIGTNSQNKANLVNSQNANQGAGRDIWNAGMESSQLINQLLGGGFKGPQNTYSGGQTLGGGLMGTGGQFMQPQQNTISGFGGGQQGGQSLPPQLMQILQQIFSQGGQGSPGGPGMMHNPLVPGTPAGGAPSATGGGPGMMHPGTMQSPNMIRPM